ncbi:MAG: glycosyltransferase family 4 protein [Rhizobiaceae bacterium]|nr:glycosyltransferase family 4 protein [Rhizobiaceae bacterium]
MKVLHFFKTYWPDTFGGIERTIHAIATGVQPYGIQSDVLSLSDRPKANSLPFDGHAAHKAHLDFEFASTGFSREVFGRFRELSRQADIIHFHFPWPLMDIVHLTSGHGKPTLVTYHSDIVKQKTLLRLYRPLMYRFLGSVDHIVATSPNYLRSSEVLQRFSAKTSVIPLGLDEAGYPAADEATKARWRARLPQRFFLFVGVLRYYKGVHILIEAARRCGLEVAIVGDGPMDAELEKQAEGLGNVHFLGALPDTDKTALLELCHAFAFPSHLRSEAFGLSLVEASMFGKPMISCEIGTGTSYVNIDGETGIVIPPNDPAALAEAMTRLWNDDALASAYGANANSRYRANFTARRMAEGYRAAYQALANERTAK